MTMTSGELNTATQFIPVIESSLFDGHSEARLAVGIVAVGDQAAPGLEREFHGYHLLRGSVYSKEYQHRLNPDGTEVADADDARSVHFAAFENGPSGVRVIGAMRLIVKAHRNGEALPTTPLDEILSHGPGAIDVTELFPASASRQGLASPWEIGTKDPLPIEILFPELFADDSVPIPSTESSRLIAQNDDKSLQNATKERLLGAGVGYIDKYGLGDAYGVVKPSLARGLRVCGLPVEELGPAKEIPEIKSKKLPIRIDTVEYVRRLRAGQPELLEAGQQESLVYFSVAETAIPGQIPPAA